MRVGINFQTHDDNISGVECYTLGLLKGLLSIDQDNQYVIYTNRPHLLKAIGCHKNLSISIVEHLKTKIQRIFWEHFCLPWIAKKDRLSILHCPHYITPIIRTDIPYVVTIHDTFALDHPEWCKWSNYLNYRLFMPRTSFKVNAIIAVSRQTQEAILKYKVCSRLSVIHPGIDDCFKLAIDRNQHQIVRSKYNLPEHYLLYVGNIEPKKNLLTLLKAYRLLQSKGIKYKLVFAGKRTWKQDFVWEYIRDNIIPGDIILTGYVDRQYLPALYQMAELFVFPSLSEGFGFPALEAMRCGTAVVASPVGILKEVPENTFCRVNPTDIVDIAEKIAAMIGDSQAKQKQIAAALSESEQFTWQQCAQKTLEIYKQIAA